jgi:hypothetical protein
MTEIAMIDLFLLLNLGRVVEDMRCVLLGQRLRTYRKARRGPTHDRTVSTLDASTIGNIGSNSSKSNGVFNSAVPPGLQPPENNKSFLFVHALA